MFSIIDSVARKVYGEFGPIQLLILQPTPYCNLACKYCYLSTKDDSRKMTSEVIDSTLTRILESPFSLLRSNRFTVVWHAGEPLVAGIDFYKDAILRIRKAIPEHIEVEHSIQTNATLIDAKWAQFIKENNIKVGVSVDGPDFIHNENRLTRSGRGSHNLTQRGMNFLREAGVEFHTISVLTKKSLDHVEEMFNYFQDQQIHMVCFNVEEQEGVHKSSSLDSQSNEKLKNFLSRFYDLTKNSKFKMTVREIQSAERAIAGWNTLRELIPSLGQETHPFSILNVDIEGNFSTFSPELLGQTLNTGEKFVFGNVFKNSLEESSQTPFFKKILKEIRKGTSSCKNECEYYGLCGGGSPSNKYHENKSFNSTQTNFCVQHKITPVDVVLKKLEESHSRIELDGCYGTITTSSTATN